MIGAQQISASYVRELLTIGAAVNEVDNAGKTALMYAAEHSRTACLKVLLEAEADPSIRDLTGKRASEIEDGSPRIQALLKEAEGNSIADQLPPLPQKLSAFMGGALEGLINNINQSDSISDLEQKGQELITQLTSDEQINQWIAQLEDTAVQQEINFYLNLLVELKEIRRKQKLQLENPAWQEEDAPRKWQQQLLWLAKQYNEQLS